MSTVGGGDVTSTLAAFEVHVAKDLSVFAGVR